MRAESVKRGRRQSPFRAVCPKGTLRKQGVWAGGGRSRPQAAGRAEGPAWAGAFYAPAKRPPPPPRHPACVPIGVALQLLSAHAAP